MSSANNLGKVNAKTPTDLILEGWEKNTRAVMVEFYPAYDDLIHSNLSCELKEELKKSKVSIFDIVNEGFDIVKLIGQKDVKSVNWVANTNI